MAQKSADEEATGVLRLVLMGMTGAGKSSCGNTILGEKKFKACFSGSSVTRCCQLERAELMLEESSGQRKRTVSVVDGPGFGDTDLTAEKVLIEISKCVSLSSPGPHAFLLVVPVGRYTEHQNQAVTQMAQIFGEEAIRDHTVVLFTRGDELEDSDIESFLRLMAPNALRELVSRCGMRFHVFNNKDTRSSEQVRVLLEKVDHMVEQRGFYTSVMYQAAEAAIREEEERLKREEEEEQQGGAQAGQPAADDKQQSTAAGGGEASQGRTPPRLLLEIRREAARSPLVQGIIRSLVLAITKGIVDVNDLGIFDRSRPSRTRAPRAGSDSVVRAGDPTLLDPAVSVEDLLAQMAHIGVRGVNTLVQRLNRRAEPRNQQLPDPGHEVPSLLLVHPTSTSLAVSVRTALQLEKKESPRFFKEVLKIFKMDPVNILEEAAEDGAAAELRLVLIGMTGAGKSSSGNTILGEKKFKACLSASSVTRCCQLARAELMLEESSGQRKRTVSVVDGPGFGDTDLTAEKVQIEISKCVSLSSPGPHAFLLVVPVGRYTEHQNQAVTQMAQIFGEEAIRDHTVVLFTRGDELEDTSIESFLRQTAPDALRDLVNRCGGRFHVFNNKDTRSSEQVRVLLEKVDHMVGQKGFYTSAMYQAAEAAIREEEERLKRLRLKKEQKALRRRARKRTADVISIGDSQPLLGTGGEHGSHQERSQLRSQAAHSPTVLDKIKAFVSAIATGLVVGAALGALTPLAAAGGAYLAGTTAGWVAGAAVEAAVGSLVAVASGETAVLCGAAVGGVVGGVVGVVGADADNPGRGALETAKTVGVIGAAAVGVGAGVGCVMGLGAQVGARAAAGACVPVVGGPITATGVRCAATQSPAGSAQGPMGPTAPPAGPTVPPDSHTPPAKSCLQKVADITKSCLESLPRSVNVKVQVKKEKPPEAPASETTTYEFSMNTKEQ
ncbi:uncharacterized protein LOC128750514 [Synchiropus splendidus]|uniref:uncharacterized protein LOC128750514 n=1 Tax=Synchiropus splendidus TaxID=270530 RepID=UPI00237E9FEC|nr:uncharacterized protein LOC128750514 [Synchiropus splendidus]